MDDLGSVLKVVDSSGNVKNSYYYDPYGNSLNKSETVTNPWQYASGYYDAPTGLYKFGTRYYDPQLGRWTQKDPIGDSVGKIGSGNPYVYADNVPTMQVDPSGRDTCLYFSNEALDTLAWGLIGIGGELGIIAVFLTVTVFGIPAAAIFASLGIIVGLVGTYILWYVDKYYPNGGNVCF